MRLVKRLASAAIFAALAASPAGAQLQSAMREFQACVACATVSMDDRRTGDEVIANIAMQTCQAYQAATLLTQKGYARSFSEATMVFYRAALQAVRQARATGYCPP